ncbi:MAG TPA: regulatory protein RecX [Marinilabiliaceae bacterium]|nr:regulatory protein RecX [Marinilabiliaceae bacterium]
MDFKTAYNKTTALCARREYCSGDMIKKLKNWEVSDEIISKVINQLKEEKFIDDTRYARFFVRDKAKFNRWGEQKIIWAMRQKQISQEVIQEAINQLDQEELQSTLLQLLKEKNRQIKEDNSYKRKAALVRFATSRGFNYAQIKKGLEAFDLHEDF